jgi:hypothetical protein
LGREPSVHPRVRGHVRTLGECMAEE